MPDQQRSSAESSRVAEIRYDIPQSARIWNYWMGGKDNFPVDRSAGDAVIEVNPGIVTVARQSRQFLIRTVSTLARDLGVRQFLDIGDAVPSGSYLLLWDSTNTSEDVVRGRDMQAAKQIPYELRTVEQLAECFEGLEMVEPGLVSITEWRPDPQQVGGPVEPVDAYGGLGRKP